MKSLLPPPAGLVMLRAWDTDRPGVYEVDTAPVVAIEVSPGLPHALQRVVAIDITGERSDDHERAIQTAEGLVYGDDGTVYDSPADWLKAVEAANARLLRRRIFVRPR